MGVASVDYDNDPNAPPAKTIVPSVTAIVPNDRGELLLIHAIDSDRWALPWGTMEIGEHLADAATRQVKATTRVDVEVTGLVGIYTDPDHVTAYGDGEVRQECSVSFTTRILGGRPAARSDISEVCFIAPHDLDMLDLHPWTRLRIEHYLQDRQAPYIG